MALEEDSTAAIRSHLATKRPVTLLGETRTGQAERALNDIGILGDLSAIWITMQATQQ